MIERKELNKMIYRMKLKTRLLCILISIAVLMGNLGVYAPITTHAFDRNKLGVSFSFENAEGKPVNSLVLGDVIYGTVKLSNYDAGSPVADIGGLEIHLEYDSAYFQLLEMDLDTGSHYKDLMKLNGGYSTSQIQDKGSTTKTFNYEYCSASLPVSRGTENVFKIKLKVIKDSGNTKIGFENLASGGIIVSDMMTNPIPVEVLTSDQEFDVLKLDHLKVEYTGEDVVEGGQIDESKIKVTAFYDPDEKNGKEVTGWVLENYVIVKGNNDLTVSYEENGVVKQGNFEVTGYGKSLKGISGVYNGSSVLGSSIEKDKLLVTAEYDNGTSAYVTGFSYSPEKVEALDTNRIHVIYTEDGVTKECDVYFKGSDKKLLELAAEYNGIPVAKGERINPTYLNVNAKFDNGFGYVPVTEYRVMQEEKGVLKENLVLSKLGDNTVSIRYEYGGIVLDKEVSIPCVENTDVNHDGIADGTLEWIQCTYSGGAVLEKTEVEETDLSVEGYFNNQGIREITRKTETKSGYFFIYGTESGILPGKNDVTVSYTHGEVTKTAKFSVEGLSRSFTGLEASYSGSVQAGEKINRSALNVVKLYDNGEKEKTEDYVIKPYVIEAGENKIVIEAEENGIVRSIAFYVLGVIQDTGLPNVPLEEGAVLKVSYEGPKVETGKKVNRAYLTVEAKFQEEGYYKVEGYQLKPEVILKTGENEILVTYTRGTITQHGSIIIEGVTNVDENNDGIADGTLEYIEAEYSGTAVEGYELDVRYLKVKAKYNNIEKLEEVPVQTKDRNGYTLIYEPIKAGKNSVTVSYTYGSVTRTALFEVRAVEYFTLNAPAIKAENLSIVSGSALYSYNYKGVREIIGQEENPKIILPNEVTKETEDSKNIAAMNKADNEKILEETGESMAVSSSAIGKEEKKLIQEELDEKEILDTITEALSLYSCEITLYDNKTSHGTSSQYLFYSINGGDYYQYEEPFREEMAPGFYLIRAFAVYQNVESEVTSLAFLLNEDGSMELCKIESLLAEYTDKKAVPVKGKIIEDAVKVSAKYTNYPQTVFVTSGWEIRDYLIKSGKNELFVDYIENGEKWSASFAVKGKTKGSGGSDSGSGDKEKEYVYIYQDVPVVVPGGEDEENQEIKEKIVYRDRDHYIYEQISMDDGEEKALELESMLNESVPLTITEMTEEALRDLLNLIKNGEKQDVTVLVPAYQDVVFPQAVFDALKQYQKNLVVAALHYEKDWGVKYIWRFLGKQIKSCSDFNMNVSIQEKNKQKTKGNLIEIQESALNPAGTLLKGYVGNNFEDTEEVYGFACDLSGKVTSELPAQVMHGYFAINLSGQENGKIYAVSNQKGLKSFAGNWISNLLIFLLILFFVGIIFVVLGISNNWFDFNSRKDSNERKEKKKQGKKN